MIVAVKRNKKQKLIKLISILVAIAMFVAYFMYLNQQHKDEAFKKLNIKKAKEIKEKKLKDIKIKYEKMILQESEKAVDLIGQKSVQLIKIVDNKIVIICDLNSNLDALMVRYGTMALVKRTIKETIVILDINYIIESKTNE